MVKRNKAVVGIRRDARYRVGRDVLQGRTLVHPVDAVVRALPLVLERWTAAAGSRGRRKAYATCLTNRVVGISCSHHRWGKRIANGNLNDI